MQYNLEAINCTSLWTDYNLNKGIKSLTILRYKQGLFHHGEILLLCILGGTLHFKTLLFYNWTKEVVVKQSEGLYYWTPKLWQCHQSVKKTPHPFGHFLYFYSQIKQESARTPEIWKIVYMKPLNSVCLLAPQPIFLEVLMVINTMILTTIWEKKFCRQQYSAIFN